MDQLFPKQEEETGHPVQAINLFNLETMAFKYCCVEIKFQWALSPVPSLLNLEPCERLQASAKELHPQLQLFCTLSSNALLSSFKR